MRVGVRVRVRVRVESGGTFFISQSLSFQGFPMTENRIPMIENPTSHLKHITFDRWKYNREVRSTFQI